MHTHTYINVCISVWTANISLFLYTIRFLYEFHLYFPNAIFTPVTVSLRIYLWKI